LIVIKGSLSRARLAETSLKCVSYQCKDGECKEGVDVCEESEPDRPAGCFVVWTTNNVTNEVNVTLKGCFTNPSECNNTECIDTATFAKKNLNYCCCRGSMCNREHKWIPEATKAPESVQSVPKDTSVMMIVFIALGSACIAIVALGVLFLTHQKQAMFNEIPTVEPDISNSSTNISHRPIDLKDIKARGRFGVVWKAQLGTQEVAVKIFPMQERQSWITEQEIFKLPRMNHPNILEFIGCEKRVDMASTDFWLITAYCENGSLCDFLKAHTSCGDTHGQVGTRRYMAPEVLEGAINFTRDAFLRIDVYACGLVLWELVSRCTVHGGPVDEYRLPFEAELGPHPTLDEMQENVVMKKLRPRIYDPWRHHAGLIAICETMEDCWDHDAEARLSSSCVLERLSQYARFPTRQFFVATNELPTKVATESL
uniref:receptor protein serine/threonine kinase n=1 Tax=Anopheles epiroticus TaxID=199890 RepID=A0A182P6U7_9DIPT